VHVPGSCAPSIETAEAGWAILMRRVQLGLPFTDEMSIGAAEISAPGPVSFYYVRHRRARRYLLRVDADGRVRVTIPRGGSRREADAFAARHRDWITQQLVRLARPTFTDDERRLLRAKARLELPVRLFELAREHALEVSRVTIRNQRTRWGSCGRDGHITLNWRLVLMPGHVRDYVLIHELMHLRRLDHSPEYWRLVADAYPEHREARSWLRRHGPSLR
jgi:predicted metal-dependent hydrolase